MTTFDRRAELRDISDQNADHTRTERDEHRSALRYGTNGTCGQGRHHMRPDRFGGGVCACGETVGRDEI